MIHVRPELDHAVWVVIPPYWGGKSWRDEQEWADDLAESRWKDWGLPHQRVDIERTSAILALTAQRYGPGYLHPEQAEDPELVVQVYLYLPHPAAIPIPVRLLVAESERLQGGLPTLRQFVVGDDPQTLRSPEVSEVQHAHFDPGLSAFHHREVHPGPGDTFESTVSGHLRYALPVPGHRAVVIVDVRWPDLGGLAGARDDIDKLVSSLRWVHYPDALSGAE